MASIFNKFMNSMKLYDDEEEIDEEEFEEQEEPAPSHRFTRRQEVSEDQPEPEPAAPRQKELRAPIRTSRKPSRDNVVALKNGMEVYMIRPTVLDDAKEVCDFLLSGRAVIINMENVKSDLAQRIVDFTSGSVFSINGNLERISKYILIVSPQSISLSGDFSEMLENSEQFSSINMDF